MPLSEKSPGYTFIDHTADLGVEIRGYNLTDLFKTAGMMLFQLMVRGRTSKNTDNIKVQLSGNDLPDLLIQWLSELLYLFAGEKLIATEFYIESLTSNNLKATLATIPFDPELHKIIREIKAVTYHQIRVTRNKSGWTARVIFDI